MQTTLPSHSFNGPTPRNSVMFGPPGRLYVYRSYGIHWCANVVTGADGDGQAVLLRALVPVAGVEAMRSRRPSGPDRELCNGPGKLCAASALDDADNGLDLTGVSSDPDRRRRCCATDRSGGRPENRHHQSRRHSLAIPHPS